MFSLPKFWHSKTLKLVPEFIPRNRALGCHYAPPRLSDCKHSGSAAARSALVLLAEILALKALEIGSGVRAELAAIPVSGRLGARDVTMYGRFHCAGPYGVWAGNPGRMYTPAGRGPQGCAAALCGSPGPQQLRPGAAVRR
jgi:hypothetical protein